MGPFSYEPPTIPPDYPGLSTVEDGVVLVFDCNPKMERQVQFGGLRESSLNLERFPPVFGISGSSPCFPPNP